MDERRNLGRGVLYLEGKRFADVNDGYITEFTATPIVPDNTYLKDLPKTYHASIEGEIGKSFLYELYKMMRKRSCNNYRRRHKLPLIRRVHLSKAGRKKDRMINASFSSVGYSKKRIERELKQLTRKLTDKREIYSAYKKMTKRSNLVICQEVN